MAKVLTQISIEKFKAPTKRKEVPDAAFSGLYLILQPSGKKLSLKVAQYIELRRDGIDPKKSCEKSGLSKSNSSRLEKTHKNLIENKQISLRT